MGFEWQPEYDEIKAPLFVFLSKGLSQSNAHVHWHGVFRRGFKYVDLYSRTDSRPRLNDIRLVRFMHAHIHLPWELCHGSCFPKPFHETCHLLPFHTFSSRL